MWWAFVGLNCLEAGSIGSAVFIWFLMPTMQCECFFFHLGFSLSCEKEIHMSPGPATCWKHLVPSRTYSISWSISSNMKTLFFYSSYFRESFTSFHWTTITESSHTCPVSLDPCWACTSRRPLCLPGNAVRLTCWKQEVSPLTLRTRPVRNNRKELTSQYPYHTPIQHMHDWESDPGHFSLPMRKPLHFIKTFLSLLCK